MLDGPEMERNVWSELVIWRSSAMCETVRYYTVKVDPSSDETILYVKLREGKAVGTCIRLEQETFAALFDLDLMALPDEESLCGSLFGLSVTDLNGNVYVKHLSSAMEQEILTLLAPYVDSLKPIE